MAQLLEKKNLIIPGDRPRRPLDKIINPIRFVRDPFVYMRRLRQEYGEVVSTNSGLVEVTFVFTPEYTRQVLSNPDLFHNGEIGDYPLKFPEDSASYRLARTLNAINGDKHRQQRRLMLPAFHRKRVDAYRDDFVNLAEARLDRWQAGQNIDLLREMKELTLSVAVKTLLGLDPQREGDQTRRLVERWIGVGSGLSTLLLPLNVPGTPFYRMQKLAAQVETEFKAMIDRKRSGGVDGGDVLSMLIAAHDENGERLTDQELVSQTLALFVAGHETTATALTWTLFLLTQHPRLMSDLLDELDGSLHGDFPTIEQVNRLPLLDRVIKESMRILSPFLWGLRLTTEDCEIGPYRVEKGKMIGFAPSIIHHDPEIYPEPQRFRPERWENFDPPAYHYLPFAAGPRMCIGATFATLEMKVILAGILQRFRLSLVPGSKVDRAGFLLVQPKNGLPVELHAQDRHFVVNRPTGNIREVVNLDSVEPL